MSQWTWSMTSKPKARRGVPVKCDTCGTEYYEGDWPYCKGDPEKHKR